MLGPVWKVILIVGFFIATDSALAASVNINTADADTIALNIRGVGPRRADAIISYRKTHGPFKDVQELTKVKGIGQKLIDLNIDRLIVSDSYSRFKEESSNAHQLR